MVNIMVPKGAIKVGKGISAEFVGAASKSGIPEKLILTIDLEQNPELSPTGKTRTVATSHGFQALETAGLKMNLHITAPK